MWKRYVPWPGGCTRRQVPAKLPRSSRTGDALRGISYRASRAAALASLAPNRGKPPGPQHQASLKAGIVPREHFPPWEPRYGCCSCRVWLTRGQYRPTKPPQPIPCSNSTMATASAGASAATPRLRRCRGERRGTVVGRAESGSWQGREETDLRANRLVATDRLRFVPVHSVRRPAAPLPAALARLSRRASDRLPRSPLQRGGREPDHRPGSDADWLPRTGRGRPAADGRLGGVLSAACGRRSGVRSGARPFGNAARHGIHGVEHGRQVVSSGDRGGRVDLPHPARPGAGRRFPLPGPRSAASGVRRLAWFHSRRLHPSRRSRAGPWTAVGDGKRTTTWPAAS